MVFSIKRRLIFTKIKKPRLCRLIADLKLLAISRMGRTQMPKRSINKAKRWVIKSNQKRRWLRKIWHL